MTHQTTLAGQGCPSERKARMLREIRQFGLPIAGILRAPEQTAKHASERLTGSAITPFVPLRPVRT